MSETLSPRLEEILAFIERETAHKGYPPSVREIGQAVGLRSPSTVHNYLNQLEELSLIRREPAKPRAMEVVDRRRQRMVAVPLVGRVAAGMPILAVENREDTYTLPFDLVRSDAAFMLRVKGDSMIGAGIRDGDYALVRQQASAEDGDIVVAMVEDEATIKRLYREDGRIRLQPDHPTLPPIVVQEAVVLGKVIGLFRRM
ncbi:MAG TPA: repressor LexA [Clostridiales bacterium]|nr:repressor LexA [Clostridiales bacterium]